MSVSRIYDYIGVGRTASAGLVWIVYFSFVFFSLLLLTSAGWPWSRYLRTDGQSRTWEWTSYFAVSFLPARGTPSHQGSGPLALSLQYTLLSAYKCPDQ